MQLPDDWGQEPAIIVLTLLPRIYSRKFDESAENFLVTFTDLLTNDNMMNGQRKLRNPYNFPLFAKTLISQGILKIKLWNFVSILNTEMGHIFYSMWPPSAIVRSSTRLPNLETTCMISAIYSGLTAFLMSSLRAVTLLWCLSHSLVSICAQK